MIQYNRHLTIDDLIESKAALIEKAVRETMPRSKFRVCTVLSEQRKRTKMLTGGQDTVHSNWESLDTERRSAACRLEWARLMIFLLVYVVDFLAAVPGHAFHVTVADERWRVAEDKLSPRTFNRPRRKLRDALCRLRRDGADPVFVAVLELSAGRNLDGTYPFEPHFHLLVLGATEPQLRRAFKVRQHSSERGRIRPVTIIQVRENGISDVLSYITKIVPEERVQWVDRKGNYNRTGNRMASEFVPLWLSCMSHIPITQLIQFGGFAGSMTYRFATCEMATLIGEI